MMLRRVRHVVSKAAPIHWNLVGVRPFLIVRSADKVLFIGGHWIATWSSSMDGNYQTDPTLRCFHM